MMNEKKTKNRVFDGVFWAFCERLANQGVSFIVSTILARILLPDDYGIVAIVNIFITIANVLLTSGLGTSLIQKHDVTDEEFSSVFYCNVVLGLILYCLIFTLSPYVSNWYGIPLIKPVLRVLALRLPISSIQAIQNAYLSRKLDFRKIFFSTIIGTSFSAAIGIAMALKGYGVWALVAQNICNAVVNVLVLFITMDWRPKLIFSVSAATPLVKYGWKVMMTDLIGIIFNQLSSFVIGIKYTTADLAYYSKGKALPQLFQNNIYSVLASAGFAAMAKHGNDVTSLRSLMRKTVRILSYVIFPLMVGMIITAEAIVTLLYTSKWIGMVPFVQLACLEVILSVPGVITLQGLKAVGRSDIMLKIEFIKKPFIVLALMIALRKNVYAIALILPLNAILELIINGIPTSKCIEYKISEQIKDCLPAMVLSIVMGIIVSVCSLIEINYCIRLVLQVCVGGISYVILSVLSRNKEFYYVVSNIKKKISHK